VTSVYFIAFFVSLAASAALTPLCIRLARRLGVMDQPDPRKVHKEPTPRWGGLGIMGAILLTLGGLWSYSKPFRGLLHFAYQLKNPAGLMGILSLKAQLAGILLGAALVLVLGLIDDKKGVKASAKVLTEIIAAYIAMTYGVRIAGISVPWGEYLSFPLWMTQIITVLWLVGMTNAVNLIDGLDGLAAGVAALVAMTFLAVAVLQDQTHVVLFAKQLKLSAVISSCIAGSCTGFLFYNFTPARVFMGDGGALGLGFLLGCVAVTGTFKTAAAAAILIPFVIAALPVADMTFSVVRRMWFKTALFQPDRGHIHHQLLDRGWTQREIVFLMYIVTLFFSIASILLTVFKGKT
jgi:UDP-GlcNAc:undecaprenyl-phosphate GlcNAc-1-phosphate transferase